MGCLRGTFCVCVCVCVSGMILHKWIILHNSLLKRPQTQLPQSTPSRSSTGHVASSWQKHLLKAWNHLPKLYYSLPRFEALGQIEIELTLIGINDRLGTVLLVHLWQSQGKLGWLRATQVWVHFLCCAKPNRFSQLEGSQFTASLTFLVLGHVYIMKGV